MLPDNVLDSTPEEHLPNMLKASDSNVISALLISCFKKIAVFEALVQNKGLDEELLQTEFDSLNDIETRITDQIIDAMSYLATNHER